MCMWLLDEDNGKEFVDDVIQPIFNDNGVMQSWEIELKKVIAKWSIKYFQVHMQVQCLGIFH